MKDAEKKLKQAVDTYNKIAAIYAKYTEEKLVQFQLARFESMLSGKKILDAGCGAGRDAAYFSEDGYDVTGIDIAENLLKEAKKRAPSAKFKKLDFRETKFRAKSFDGVWSMAGFLHLPKEEIEKSLKEFNRILKPNGKIYVSVKQGSGSKEIKKEKYKGEPRIYYFYKKEEIEDMLREAGFKIHASEENEVWIEIFAEKKEN